MPDIRALIYDEEIQSTDNKFYALENNQIVEKTGVAFNIIENYLEDLLHSIFPSSSSVACRHIFEYPGNVDYNIVSQ